MALDASATPVPLAAKPRLRGMLHLIAFPVSLFAGTMLVTAWARGLRATIGSAVYAVTGAVLFGVSALYHRGQWDERTHALLRRLDHSNIFLLIAGTYTPIVLMLLDGASQVALLVAVWVGALAGILFRLVWLDAPRWLYTPFYVGLGWVAIAALPELARNGGGTTVALLVIGGLAYSVGGLVYGLRWPDPVPTVFGYHEVFHSCTLAGFAAHYVAVVLVVR